MTKRKIAVGISGASGVHLGVKFVKILSRYEDIEQYVILSHGAIEVAKHELKSDLKDMMPKNITLIDDDDLSSPLSSGSFNLESFCIIPTSMDTLAKIASGISDSAILRCSSVMIKEQRRLILAPREMPFSAIALKQMSILGSLNVIIAPPILAYYSNIATLEDMENFIIGKWLDLLKIENQLYKRWRE